jgi:hypothetical protein
MIISAATLAFIALGSAALAQELTDVKVDVLNICKAIVTATPWDIGHPDNCFDGNASTIMRSANINPAFVQVAFPDTQAVNKLRVLLGQPGYPYIDQNSWWVETADTQEDLDNKTGSYKVAVPERFGVAGTWDEVSLPNAVQKKIWRFWVTRTVGDGYVHIPELELWTRGTPEELRVRTDYNALLLIYDPQLGPSQQYKTISDYFGWWPWYDDLIPAYIEGLWKASGGQVNWHVKERHLLYEFLPSTDPSGPWTADTYVDNYNGLRQEKMGDYHAILNDPRFDIIRKVESGEIDAVWMMGFPFTFFFETAMAGRGAYWINGIVPDVESCKKFVIYGFSYERGVGCMFENTAHMTEQIMERHGWDWPKTGTFPVWNILDFNDPNRRLVPTNLNDWKRFSLSDTANYGPDIVSPGNAGAGLAHFPPNASYNYGWGGIFDDFRWGAGPWRTFGGTWQVINGEYVASAGDGVKSLMYDGDRQYPVSDFVGEADLAIANETSPSSGGFLFRMTDFSEGRNIGKGYYVGLDAYRNRVFLARMNNNLVEIAAASKDIRANQWYHVKIVAQGANIDAYVDDMIHPLIQATDGTFDRGGLGVTAYSTEARFDNIDVNVNVPSYADNWHKYPDLTGEPRRVNSLDWARNQDDWFRWWFEHIPKNPGTHAAVDIGTGRLYEGILNSWWPYILDLNRFSRPLIYEGVVSAPPDTEKPEPPANVRLLGSSSDSVSLAWDVPYDNIGVTRYEVYRNGVLIQEIPWPEYTDEGLARPACNTYSIKARDGSGNVSQGSELVFCDAVVSKLTPTDDAWVNRDKGGKHGKENHLKIQNDRKDGYLKFSLQGIRGTVSSAKLTCITSLDDKSGKVHVHAVKDNDWKERTIQGTNAPPLGDYLDSAVAYGEAGETLTWDVTGFVADAVSKGADAVSFALVMTEGYQVYFSSKENKGGREAPVLKIE